MQCIRFYKYKEGKETFESSNPVLKNVVLIKKSKQTYTDTYICSAYKKDSSIWKFSYFIADHEIKIGMLFLF